jgi:acyl-CoA synthetase (AMP-forming)/AMP-acid ligase II
VRAGRSNGVLEDPHTGPITRNRALRIREADAGYAERCESKSGTTLVSYGVPQSPVIRIVDPDQRRCPAGTVGEIWAHGDNVSLMRTPGLHGPRKTYQHLCQQITHLAGTIADHTTSLVIL